MVVEADKTAHSAIRTALDLLEPCDNVSLILNKAAGTKSAERLGSYYAPACGAHRRNRHQKHHLQHLLLRQQPALGHPVFDTAAST